MTGVDWDEVGSEALETPRAILAEYLAHADEFETVIILAAYKSELAKDYDSVFRSNGKRRHQVLGLLYEALTRYGHEMDRTVVENEEL